MTPQMKNLTLTPEELNSHSQFLESILLHIPHMVFVKEANELRFVLFNKAGEDLLGLKNADLHGKNDYDFFSKEQADHFVAADRKVLDGKKMILTEEEPIDSPGLGRRYLRTKKVPILDAAGKPIYLLGISEDITDIKASQKTIEEQRNALAISSRLSALGEMAGGIAHEINNPLAIISGLSDKLGILIRKNELTNERASDVVGRINKTVMRISNIINTMRGIVRDGSKDSKGYCDLNQIVQDTLSLCGGKLEESGVIVKFTPLPKAAPVMARTTEISQVIVNLLQNAHDAVQDCQEKWIAVELEAKDGRIYLAISDSGAGIPANVRDKVMQPFFSTKPIGKGTGLGLSISRSIIEGHGGTLQLGVKAGRTCFYFDLEQVARKSAAA